MNKPESGFATDRAAKLQPLTAGAERASSPARHKNFAESFAQIVAVLMRDRYFRTLTLADLESLVLPPLIAGQFGLAHAPQPRGNAQKGANGPADGVLVPVAVALWARVSANVDKALSENLDRQPSLQPTDWVSGEHIWLIILAGDQRAVPKFLGQLREKDFRGRRVKIRVRGNDGKAVIKTLG